MSETRNIEIARRFTEALARGEYEAAAAVVCPELEIDDRDIPESTRTDSLFTWLARWDEIWESWRIEDLDVRAIGNDRTISFFTIIVRGNRSGIELARQDATIAEFCDGKIVRIGCYNDQAQAAEAVGLAQQR